MDIIEDDDELVEEEVEEEQLDPNNPDHAFLILEKEFTKVISEIEQNPAIVDYADDFSKLFQALYTTNGQRKDLAETVKDLEEQLIETTDKLDLAVKLTEADAGIISSYKGEIQHAYRLADGAHEREQQAQEIMENLRREVNTLTKEIEFKNKMGGDGAEDAAAVSKDQEGLQKDRDRLAGEVHQLQTKLANAIGYQEELERKNSQADVRINEIIGQLEDQIGELNKTKKHGDELEEDIKDLNAEIMRLNREIMNYENQNAKNVKITARLERQVTDLTSQKEKLTRDLESLGQKHGQLQDDHSALNANYEEMKADLHKKNMEIKLKDDEGLKMRNEIAKFAKLRDQYDKKLTLMDIDKMNISVERDKMRSMYSAIEKEVDYYKKQSDLDKRTMDGMNREKDVLNKNILKQQTVVRDHLRLLKIQEQTRKKLEEEIDQFHVETNKLQKQLSHLEKERDRMVEEQLDLTKKIEDLMDDIKMQKLEVYNLNKNLAENDVKFTIQQTLFENVRAERNNLQKQLQEMTSECGELKNKLKVSNHQSQQLKEDIAAKEQQLIRDDNILRKVTKEKDNLRVELDNALENTKQLKNTINEMNAEEKRLHKVIAANDRTIKELTANFEQLMNERDVLGSQLVRRNDELGLLYQKIKILQTTLQRGEAHYERRLEDIRLLKIEVKRLRQEKNLLAKSISNLTDLRQEVFHLQRDLTRERLKARALEEEVQNPLNIHRWRKLEGSDPSVFELLKKLQLMQKRLLQQSGEAVQRERKLKEAEKLYVNLRAVLARQPGPDIKNDLLKTQRALTVRGNKMKCLVSELNMTEQQSIEYKEDLDRLKVELKELKQKYLIEKKANQRRVAAAKEINSNVPNQAVKSADSSQIRFSGGGFKMSMGDF